MRKIERAWFVGTATIVLVGSVVALIAYGYVYHADFLMNLVEWIAIAIVGVVAFLMLVIALPLMVGEKVMEKFDEFRR